MQPNYGQRKSQRTGTKPQCCICGIRDASVELRATDDMRCTKCHRENMEQIRINSTRNNDPMNRQQIENGETVILPHSDPQNEQSVTPVRHLFDTEQTDQHSRELDNTIRQQLDLLTTPIPNQSINQEHATLVARANQNKTTKKKKTNANGKKESQNQVKETPCEKCTKVTNKQTECEICNKWHCTDCADITETQYETLTSNSNTLKYICQDCAPIYNNIIATYKSNRSATTRALIQDNQSPQNNEPDLNMIEDRFQAMEEKHTKKVEEKLKQIETTIQTIAQNVTTKERIDRLEDTIQMLVENNKESVTKQQEATNEMKQINQEVIQTYANVVEGIKPANNSHETSLKPELLTTLSEYNEREKRKNNLIIYGIAENGYLNQQLKEIFHSIGVTGIEITNCTRLGNFQAKNNSSKPRPVRIAVKDTAIKRNILSRAKQLRDTRHKTIYISPDMTFQEREENRLLLNELKNRQQQGENVMIKQGKIVPRPVPQAQARPTAQPFRI